MTYPRDPARRRAHQATVAGLRAALGDRPFRQAWADGARLTLDEAVAYARRGRGPRRRPATGWASLTPPSSTLSGWWSMGSTTRRSAAASS